MPQLLYNLALFFVTYALVQLTCDIWIRWAISEKKMSARCDRGEAYAVSMTALHVLTVTILVKYHDVLILF